MENSWIWNVVIDTVMPRTGSESRYGAQSGTYGPRAGSRRSGFTYIALLAGIAVIGILMGAAGKYWRHIMLREKEEELLFRGQQYVMAIRSYYMAGARPGIQPQLTPDIEDLLKDARSGTLRRHLRQKFKDPMTGDDFVLLRDRRTRAIVGVRSRSDDEPLKKTNFPVTGMPELDAMYKTFEGKTKYSEWRFIFTPSQVIQPWGAGHPPAQQQPLIMEIVDDTGDAE